MGLAVFPLLFAAPANAACPPLPYTFTNGQTADASQVMGDLNAIQVCIGNNGIVSAGAAGQVATYGAIGSTVSGASLSSVLDASVSSTQGTILYRNATGWAALLPGTTGQVLVTGGPSANPSWGSGGQASPFYSTLTTPLASAFTLVPAPGITATLADLASGRGPTMNITGTGGESMASMERAVLSQTAFTVTTCIYLAGSLDGNWFVGIGIKDSTGKYDALGWRNAGGGAGVYSEFTFSDIGHSSGFTNSFGVFNATGPTWLKLQLTGGNFVLSASHDGETWETVKTISATHYLGATLSTAGIIVDNNSARHFIVDDLSWSQSTP